MKTLIKICIVLTLIFTPALTLFHTDSEIVPNSPNTPVGV
jgi:hypothetical protein